MMDRQRDKEKIKEKKKKKEKQKINFTCKLIFTNKAIEI